MKVWLNGALVDGADASVPVTDKGLLVGDGVFETMRAYDGIAFALEDHLERLQRSAAALRVELPDIAGLGRAVRDVLAVNELRDARLRVTVTSGSGPAGLGRGDGEPTVLVTATSLSEWPPTATAIISPWPRNERSVLAGVKTTSNAENVAKLAHAREQEVDEAISLNLAGNLCEGTTSNVFVVNAGRVRTPPLSAGCLAGITRDYLIPLGPEAGVEIVEEDVWGAELRDADELFLTSSTRELQPLVELDGHAIGDGGIGPVTKLLAAEFSAMVARRLR